MDFCAYCGEGIVEEGHEYCRDCERMAAKIEQQLTLAGDWE